MTMKYSNIAKSWIFLCSFRNGVGPVTANKSTRGAGVGSNFNCVNIQPWDTQHVHKHQEDLQKHGLLWNSLFSNHFIVQALKITYPIIYSLKYYFHYMVRKLQFSSCQGM